MRKDLRHSDSPDDLRRLRIALRKARSLGEFFSPVLGPPIDKLTRRVHAAEPVLGKLQDTDIGLARLAREGPASPRKLAEPLHQRRCAQLIGLDKQWRRLERLVAQRDVRRKLNL